MNARPGLIAVLCILTILCCLIATAMPESSHATFPGSNGKIAFERHIFDESGINPEIFVMEADGSNPTRLTNSPGRDSAPAWSPDGRRIAFAREGDVFVMNGDGSNAIQLTSGGATDFAPAWSPDGTKVAFGSLSRQEGSGIYVMNCDGSGVRFLHGGPFFGFDGPDWSPDGSRIAFGIGEVYVINPDGSGLSQVADVDPMLTDLAPSWSPDGSQIAFLGAGALQAHDVHVVDSDGTNQRNLTNSSASEDGVSWSPDGRKLAFISSRDGNQEVYAMDADGGNVTRLTNDSLADLQPDWQPIGGAPIPACSPASTPSASTPLPASTSAVVPSPLPTQPAVALPAGGGAPTRDEGFLKLNTVLAASLYLATLGSALWLAHRGFR